MQLYQYRFYRGVNLWGSQSGWLLDCRRDQGSGLWAAQSRAELSASLARFNALLSDAAPVSSESEYLQSSHAWLHVADPEAHCVLAIAEVVSRDFCWMPMLGRVISQHKDSVRLFVPCHDEAVGWAAIRFALTVARLAPGAIPTDEAEFRSRIGTEYQSARRSCRLYGLNQSSLALARCASRHGIPVTRLLVPGQHVRLGQGRQAKTIMETGTSLTSAAGLMMSTDKLATNTLLSQAGIPTPDTHAVTTIDEALKVAAKLGFPVVVKPRAGGKGVDVTVNIRTEEELRRVLHTVSKRRQGLIVERHIAGDDYRLLVVAGRLVAAARRLPAHVTGDGKSTIAQLIAQANRDPQRGMPFERLREKLQLDAEAVRNLARAGMDQHAIPAPGQAVQLQGAANIALGGTAVDVTDEIHPDNRRIAERAARLVGLDVAGIDFLTPDIRRSWREVRSAILEVNATPGLRPHLGSNPDRDVLSPMIRHLFPGDADGRVPVVGITGSVGKTTTTRMIAAMLKADGKTVAMATTQGASIGDDRTHSGDLAGGGIAQALLSDPSVDAGVFELARGGLMKMGMVLDGVDVGVVLNVYDNHVGIDGISSRDQLAQIKSLVVRHARKWAVLNADDPLCLAMREVTVARQICLVSARGDHPAVVQHLAAGGTAVTLDGDGLTLQAGTKVIGRLRLAEIPATLGGQFRPPMFNALFAVAAAHALQLPFARIQAALRQFHSDYATNPGRMNQIIGLPFEVFIAHTDGPQALAEVARFVRSRPAAGPKSYVVSAAGNRPNQFILESGRVLAGAFDTYICTDMEEDLRGRPPGEAANLLAEGLRQAGVPEASIIVEPSGSVAVAQVMRETRPGALLIIESYRCENVLAAVQAMWPGARM